MRGSAIGVVRIEKLCVRLRLHRGLIPAAASCGLAPATSSAQTKRSPMQELAVKALRSVRL